MIQTDLPPSASPQSPPSSPLPAPYREIELGGRTFRLRPPCVRDHEELMRWVQDRVIANARKAAEGLERSERIEILQAAVREASRLTLTSPETLRVLRQLEGATRFLLYCLRDEHPDLDQAQLINLLSDPLTIMKTLETLRKLNEEAAAAEGAFRSMTIDPK